MQQRREEGAFVGLLQGLESEETWRELVRWGCPCALLACLWLSTRRKDVHVRERVHVGGRVRV